MKAYFHSDTHDIHTHFTTLIIWKAIKSQFSQCSRLSRLAQVHTYSWYFDKTQSYHAQIYYNQSSHCSPELQLDNIIMTIFAVSSETANLIGSFELHQVKQQIWLAHLNYTKWNGKSDWLIWITPAKLGLPGIYPSHRHGFMRTK